MNCEVSPFTIEMYDGVLALWQECEGVGLSDADSRECILAYLRRNPGMSFVATGDGSIIGAALAGHDGRRGYIHHLAVHPDHRRQGLGGQLVDRCLHALREAGIRKCHIFIFSDNSRAIAFWQSAEWMRRTDICVMSRSIDAPD